MRCQDMASPRSGGYWPDGRGEGSATQPNSRYPTSWPTRARAALRQPAHSRPSNRVGMATGQSPNPPHWDRAFLLFIHLLSSRARGAPTQQRWSAETRNQTDPLAPPAGRRRRFLVYLGWGRTLELGRWPGGWMSLAGAMGGHSVVVELLREVRDQLAAGPLPAPAGDRRDPRQRWP